MKMKKVISMGMVATMLMSTNVFAESTQGSDEVNYEETHYQVNFDNIDVFVVDGSNIEIMPNENVSKFSRSAVNNDIAILENALDEYSEAEEELINVIKNNEELVAVSFTEAPLILVEDHYERVPVSTNEGISTYATSQAESSKNYKEKFSLWTTVSKPSYTNSNGKYDYTAKTYGAWSENSILGGSKYPAAGEDYVLQATPNTWTRSTDNMTAYYDNTPMSGVTGTDFWRTSGGANYLKYVILDDPSGYRQNTSFALTSTSEATSNTNAKMINSYYVHTWKSMSVDVQVGVNTSKEVSLTVTPKSTSESWQLYNYVTFNF